jgi:hypothetical protein
MDGSSLYSTGLQDIDANGTIADNITISTKKGELTEECTYFPDTIRKYLS